MKQASNLEKANKIGSFLDPLTKSFAKTFGIVDVNAKMAENTSKISSLTGYANTMGTIGKSLAIVGAVAGIATDIYRDKRISKLETSMAKSKEGQEKIVDCLENTYNTLTQLKLSSSLSTKQLQELNIIVKDKIKEHTEQFITQEKLTMKLKGLCSRR